MAKKYNPKKVTITWGAIEFSGFMDGVFVECEYDEARVTVHTGTDGEVTFALNASEVATVTVTLAQSSKVNAQLSARMPRSKLNRLPVAEFQIKDLGGTTVVHSESACIETVAPISFGNEIEARAWVFKLPAAEITVGDNEVAS